MISKDRDEQILLEIGRTGEDLYRLATLPIIKEQLQMGNGVWLAKPEGLPLDLAFLQRPKTKSKDEEISFLGLSMCGKENVIGLHVRKTSGTVENGLRLIEKDIAAMELIQSGARVLVLTPRELHDWADFYTQIYGSGLVDTVGERALSFSGLEWLSNRESDEMFKSLEAVLGANWDYVRKFGVRKVEERGDVDLVFMGQRGKLLTVPIYHLRDWSFEGEIMRESVREGAADCAGMIVRKVGETKRDFYQRAMNARKAIQRRFDRPVELALVSTGQTSLWKKMGFAEEWKAIDTEAELTAEEVVRFLYLGKSNLEPGVLAVSPWRLSLPGKGDVYSFPGIDVVFMQRRNNLRRATVVDNLAVWDKHGKLISLSNVAGIRIFPKGANFDQMKEFMEPVKKEFLHRMGLPGAYVLNLTPELFALWRANGSPFFPSEGAKEVVNGISLRKRHEYFAPTRMDKGWYFQLRQKEEIGGNKNGLVLMDAAGNQVAHLWDVGLGFSDMPRGLNGIGREPNTADGLLRLLRLGILPMKPGWWSRDYLMQTAIKMTGLSNANFVRNDPVAQYLVAELSSRVGETEIREKLKGGVARTVMEMGPEYRKKWWGNREYLVDTASPTHPHADHINLTAYLDPSIRIFASGPMVGFMEALSHKAGTWRRRFTDRKLLTEPRVGRSYQTEDVDLQAYFFSDRSVRISPQVSMTPYFVPHSVPATWQMYEVRLNGGKTTVFNSGDWRVDGSSRVFDIAGKLAGKPDVILMEATNFDNEKIGMGHSEETVKRTLQQFVGERKDDLIVTVAPINNLARLKKILEVAEKTGRNVALSYSHAEIALQMAAAKEFAPAGAEGFEDVLPYDLGDGRLTVWAKQMTNPRAYHKALYSIASRGDLGVLESHRLGRENNKWIVVVSPFEVLQDQFDGLNIKDHMDILWMASFPYDREQKLFIGANMEWIRNNGKIRFVADMEVRGQGGVIVPMANPSGILHVSGHAAPGEVVDVLDLLVGNGRKNVPVIINHSDNPEVAAKWINGKLGDRVKLIWQMDRYDPNDPLNKRGFYYPLT